MAEGPKSRFNERDDDASMGSDASLDLYDDEHRGSNVDHRIIRGPPLAVLTDLCPQAPYIIEMEQISTNNCIFMVKPFKYDPTRPDSYPQAINGPNRYNDSWNEQHVRMPCSPSSIDKNGEPRWRNIRHVLFELQKKCDQRVATVDDLKKTIQFCADRPYNTGTLDYLLKEVYSNDECADFMSTVLSNICSLAVNVDIICSRPPPILRAETSRSVVMSQQQAASLLACAFFCLFPCRSSPKTKKEYEHFQNPNFNALYLHGGQKKAEKLRCILHYFKRITTKMPNGIITFRRYAVPSQYLPKWSQSSNNIMPMHLTTSKKIEDIECVLQVDFANKYIGGGVLDSGCVQEEIRFVLCPEMLVSLLVCEAMQPDECIFLIGCERYSTYKGYSSTFRYAGDYIDAKPKDNWGRKWTHLVAIDALYYRERSMQYDMKYIKRDLLKAYAAFFTRGRSSDFAFPIATGNWGCGAFNGDRELKAIIQLIAASQAVRPLIYAAYGDKKLIESFATVFDYLIGQRATVRDLYRYLQQYCETRSRPSLFDFILRTPVKNLR